MTNDKITNAVAVEKITLNLSGDNIAAGPVQNPSDSKIIDPKAIFKIIFANLKSAFRFVVNPQKPSSDQFKENGRLHTNFLLSEVRKWTGNTEREDPQILNSLDLAAVSGKIKIYSISSRRDLNISDISFDCEIGLCEKNYRGQICLQNFRFYDSEPLKREEFDSFNLLDIGKKVTDIREQIHDRLKKWGGKSGLSMELRLRKEEREEDLDLKRRLCGMIDPKPKENDEK